MKPVLLEKVFERGGEAPIGRLSVTLGTHRQVFPVVRLLGEWDSLVTQPTAITCKPYVSRYCRKQDLNQALCSNHGVAH
jgi:hypothetical protein